MNERSSDTSIPLNADAPVRLCVIGAGAIGAKHAEIASRMDGCRLVGVCDINQIASRRADRLGADGYQNFETMIDAQRPDGVIIATPTELHSPIGIVCATHGIHLLIEKPISADLGGGMDLIRSAEFHRVRLLVGHHRRFNPLVEAARRIVRSGGIGRLVAVNVVWTAMKPTEYFEIEWHRRPGAGPVLTNLIHDIDNLRYVCGEIDRVFAEVSSAVRRLAVEDTAGVTVRFIDGAVGTMLCSDCVASGWSYETTTGENDYYPRTEEDCYFFYGTEGTLAFPSMRLVRYRSPAASGWQYPLEIQAIEVAEADPLVRQMAHFREVIRGTQEPVTDGRDALRSLAVARAVLESGSTGRSIRIDRIS